MFKFVMALAAMLLFAGELYSQECPKGACPQSIVVRSYETVAVDTVYTPTSQVRAVVAHNPVVAAPGRRRVAFTTRTTMVPVKTHYKTVTRTRRLWR